MILRTNNFIRKLMDSLNLTSYESKAYLALVEMGTLTVSRLSEISGIPRSKCYDVLRGLILKGMVSKVSSKPVKYQALPPELAFNNRVSQLSDEISKKIEKAEKTKKQLLNFLKVKGTLSKEIKILFLENIRSITSAIENDVVKAEKEILIAMTRAPAFHDWAKSMNKFKSAYFKGVSYRFLVYSAKQFIEKISISNDVKNWIKEKRIKIRETSLVYQPFAVIDGKIGYIFLTDPMRRITVSALRIQDERFAMHLKTHFELLWSMS